MHTDHDHGKQGDDHGQSVQGHARPKIYMELVYELCYSNPFWRLAPRKQSVVMHRLLVELVKWAGGGDRNVGKRILDHWQDLTAEGKKLLGKKHLNEDEVLAFMTRMARQLRHTEKLSYNPKPPTPCPNCYYCPPLHCSIRHGIFEDVLGAPRKVATELDGERYEGRIITRLHIETPLHDATDEHDEHGHGEQDHGDHDHGDDACDEDLKSVVQRPQRPPARKTSPSKPLPSTRPKGTGHAAHPPKGRGKKPGKR